MAHLARFGHAAAFHESAQELLLFGGCTYEYGGEGDWCPPGDVLGDTRTLAADGSWTEHDPLSSPAARYGHAVVYDPSRRKTLLFGGQATENGACCSDQYSECCDTWEWDGQEWRRLWPDSIPEPRYGHAMAYDPRREVVVMFGGCRPAWGFCSFGNGTFEWDGDDWHLREPDRSPPRRAYHGLAYDPVLQAVVLFGGEGLEAGACGAAWTSYCSDTWTWDGDVWEELPTTDPPPARTDPALAYDEVSRKLILHGGLGFTWGVCGPEGTPLCSDTWTYGSAQVTPHLLVSFDLGSSRTVWPSRADPSTKLVQEVGVHTRAGAVGRTLEGGRTVRGYTLSVSAFGHGGWLPLHVSEDATPEQPEEWQQTFGPAWSCGEARCADAAIGDWPGANGKLYLDLAARAPQGASPEPAVAALDYVELAVRYWRTGCEPPSMHPPDGTPDGTPCSDGDPATQGETCQGRGRWCLPPD